MMSMWNEYATGRENEWDEPDVEEQEPDPDEVAALLMQHALDMVYVSSLFQ